MLRRRIAGLRIPEVPEHVHGRVLAFHRRKWWPAVVAGLLMFGSFPPLDVGWLAIPAWALLFTSIRLREGDGAAKQCFVAALVLFVPGLAWIQPVMTTGWLFVALWCAAWEGLFGWVLSWFLRKGTEGRAQYWIFLAAPFHVLVDLLRGWFMTGFPWLTAGYAAHDIPVLLGSADLFGVHGATLVLLLSAACIAEAFSRILELTAFPVRPLYVAALAWLAAVVWTVGKGDLPVTTGPEVVVLQGNISQQTKEDREEALGGDGDFEAFLLDWHERHVKLAKDAEWTARKSRREVALIIWPETMVVLAAARRPLDDPRNDELWQALARISNGRPTLAGVISIGEGEPAPRYNTAALIDPRGRFLAAQDKQHLTPGGEYLPGLGWVPGRAALETWLRKWAGYVPALQAGTGPVLLPVPLRDDKGSLRAGVMICYEIAFPDVCRDLVDGGADFLVNSSNYGWFAGTAMMAQTEAMGRFRAAESRRSLVFASNNGPSGVVGPDGTPLKEGEGRWLPPDREGWVLAPVPICRSAAPYSQWGDAPAWVLGALTVLVGTLVAVGGERA